MEQCWARNPLERPRFPQIKLSLRQITKGDVDKSNIVDLLIQRMETYATDLEGVAQEKTRAFLEEKKKADELLNQILPPMVAEKLKKGQVIPPEVFKSTTIFFSDIVGFAALSMESSPMEIVDFLNDLYSLFDATIPKFDVYKVQDMTLYSVVIHVTCSVS
ncbi:hypothetical protein RvY_18092-2 [Ramazzottius varieornatus]|uniref:Guanylate cyclase domain-containing protein n=1 Tax=Ramazzottius varieornatus TaxID=947166 RepID=A0A1D1WAM2_RAMVA|nr:hypothetical protein RvY_18092-2 [Ramazzottius varieornatus]